MDMRESGYIEDYLRANPRASKCVEIAESLVKTVGDIDPFLSEIGPVLRRAVDEVIDMPRTSRFSLSQIEKTEKTYIGTKVEILIRHALALPKGNILDLRVGDEEVDIKNTIGSSWMIPREAIDRHCLLIKINDKKGLFNIGVVFCSLDNITAGMNRDQKRSISPGNPAIFWIGRNVPMQKNFFESLSPGVCLQLTDPKASGAERVRRLCRLVPNTVFNRYIVNCVAQQQDPMKRLRNNGGARDAMLKEEIYVLSGKYDKDQLISYGFHNVGHEEWVAVHPQLLPRKR